MSTSKKKSTMLGMLTLGMLAASLMIGSDAYASAIQAQPPEVIFAASCATCHGSTGQGGVTWVKDGPGDNRRAPNLSGLDRRYVVSKVRSGAKNGAMPAFGREEVTDAELNALANWIQAGGSDATVANGLNAPAVPGQVVNLYILDADPWFSDDANWSSDGDYDDNTAAGTTAYSSPSADVRRVALANSTATVKVINTGRTWHTLTNSAKSKDSGFIGYAGNYNIDAGDLGDMGYYYADQTTGLASGCERYLCKMHPYMQVEVCTSGNSPEGPTAAGTTPAPWAGLTRAHKHPLPTYTGTMGVGEVWVTSQSQDNPGEDTVSLDLNNSGKSVVGMDGAYQIIDATTFTAVLPSGLKNVGNNPHNAWPIDENGDGTAEAVLSANWHDNTVTLMDANPYNRVVLNEKKLGATTAHAMAQPDPNNLTDERFFVTQMGGRGIHEVDLADLRAGLDANLGAPIAGATGPHGLWFCGDGSHILTADTFGNSATWYNIDSKESNTAGSGGSAPLAPSIFDPGTGAACSRGFTNNALTADISVYNMTGDTISRNTGWAEVPAGRLYKKAPAEAGAGNIKLRVTNIDQTDGLACAPGDLDICQARWVHLPIQTPVSPAGSTHPRYMVTANKASFNVSVTELNASGDPVATYTFPAGLGAHGVTYGKKATCSHSSTTYGGTTYGAGPSCYYAYVTNTFEDYVSVYDLEKINALEMGVPGSALLAESVYVEGGAVAAVAALDPVVASLCDVVDLVAGVLVYDLPAGADPGGDGNASGTLTCGIGAMGGAGAIAEGGPIGGYAYYVSNLPIGVLCPDCRSGVHVADIPLNKTTGAALGGTTTTPLSLTATGAGSKYTYLKEEVWVDTATVACALGANDCDNTLGEGLDGPDGICGTPDDTGACEAGNLNTVVELDLELGINTGGQGIVGVPAATPWP